MYTGPLGRDWLIKNGVRLYFDLGSLRIGKTYVPMVEDIHIASILRTNRKTILKPQSTTVCLAKHRNHAHLVNKTVEVSAVDDSFVSKEPGLMLGNALAKTKPSRAIPVLLINNTNKTFRLRRGCIIGRINVVDEGAIASITKEEAKDSTSQDLTDGIDVPPEHREMITELLEQNKDLFAKTDAELGHTSTIQMKIDTTEEATCCRSSHR